LRRIAWGIVIGGGRAIDFVVMFRTTELAWPATVNDALSVHVVGQVVAFLRDAYQSLRYSGTFSLETKTAMRWQLTR
jgi:hypothetical protein